MGSDYEAAYLASLLCLAELILTSLSIRAAHKRMLPLIAWCLLIAAITLALVEFQGRLRVSLDIEYYHKGGKLTNLLLIREMQ